MFSHQLDPSERITALLNEYDELVRENHGNWRALIPSKEMWRFFVDGDVQEKGKRLSSYFSGEIPDCTILELAQRENERHWRESPFIKFLKSKRWNLTDEECSKYTIKDFLSIDKAWMQYENEPGYLMTLCEAFQAILDPSVDLSDGFIKKLHKLAMEGATGARSPFASEVSVIGEFRHSEYATCELNLADSSVEGFFEILSRHHPEINFSITFYDSNDQLSMGSLKINKESLQEIKWFVDDVIKQSSNATKLGKYSESHVSGFINKLKEPTHLKVLMFIAESKNEKELAERLYHMVKHSDSFNHINLALQSWQEDEEPSEVIKNEISSYLQRYQNAMDQAYTPQDKLKAIVRFIQSCHQLHPFIDGNGRTFIMLMLNHLLLRNGFPIAILNRTGKFGGHSEKELLDAVIEGMQNTLELIKEKKLFNIDTNDIVQLLDSKKSLYDLANYFNKMVTFEEAARSEYLHANPMRLLPK